MEYGICSSGDFSLWTRSDLSLYVKAIKQIKPWKTMNGILTASEKTLCALPRYWVSYQPNIQKGTHISEMALSEYRISSTAPDLAHEQDGLADLWRWMFAGPELVWHSCGTPSSGDRNSRHFATDNASGPAYTNPSNASSFFELFQMFFFFYKVCSLTNGRKPQ